MSSNSNISNIGDTSVAGLDEAGRGALAGPVVAGAVMFPEKFAHAEDFQDSKILSDARRRELFTIIKTECDWGIGIVSAKEIDSLGIPKATHLAMKIAVSNLLQVPKKLLVDGCDHFRFEIPSKEIIRGDALEKIISAASILAKVIRDDYLLELGKQYPEFNFQENKGYGCAHHIALLEKEIFTPEHRKTYEPLQTILTQGKFLF